MQDVPQAVAVPAVPRTFRKLRSVEAIDGPANADELGMWDAFIAHRIQQSAGFTERLRLLLRQGAVGWSDFSGYDAPVEACRAGIPSVFSDLDLPSPHIEFVRSADSGGIQQSVLMGMSRRKGCSHCVMGKIEERQRPGVTAPPPPCDASDNAADKQLYSFRKRAWLQERFHNT